LFKLKCRSVAAKAQSYNYENWRRWTFHMTAQRRSLLLFKCRDKHMLKTHVMYVIWECPLGLLCAHQSNLRDLASKSLAKKITWYGEASQQLMFEQLYKKLSKPRNTHHFLCLKNVLRKWFDVSTYLLPDFVTQFLCITYKSCFPIFCIKA